MRTRGRSVYWRIQGVDTRGRGAPLSLGLISLIHMQFSAKSIAQNIGCASSPSGKSYIRHWLTAPITDAVNRYISLARLPA